MFWYISFYGLNARLAPGIVQSTQIKEGSSTKRYRTFEKDVFKFFQQPRKAVIKRIYRRYNRVLLYDALKVFFPSKLPWLLWDFSLPNVTGCKIFLWYLSTKAIPYVWLADIQSKHLRHIRLFGCRMMYQSVTNQLRTFGPRFKKRISLGHDGGGENIHFIPTSSIPMSDDLFNKSQSLPQLSPHLP